MLKIECSSWKIVALMVVILAVGVVVLLNFTHQSAIDLINGPAKIFLPENPESYESILFTNMVREMDRFPEIMTPEIMKKEGVASILHGTMDGETIGLFERFVADSSNGKAAQIIIAVHTVEGDPIYMNVLFDRVRYLAVIESTRDRLHGNDEDGENLRYDYLKIITNPETESKFVILTNNAELTFEQLRIAQIGSNMESIDSFQLFSYYE